MQLKKPYLSVIMPVYNAELYVEQAIRSILNQTFRDLELICINDCSKDKSLEIMLKLSKEDDRLLVIDSPENLGAGQARNLGLARAAGKYITFMDADDKIDADLYRKAADIAENNDIDEVVWGLTEQHYDSNDNFIRSVPIAPENKVANNKKDILDTILFLEDKTLFGYQWNSFYKASIIKENGIQFEKSIFYEDFFFNLEYAKHIKSISTIDDTGYFYYKRVNGSITNSFTADYFDLSYRRIDEMLEFFKSNSYVDEKVCTVLGNRLLRYTLSALQRNCDKRSGMGYKYRKEWFLKTCQLPLYKELLNNSKISNPAYYITAFVVKHKMAVVADLLGMVIRIIRK